MENSYKGRVDFLKNYLLFFLFFGFSAICCGQNKEKLGLDRIDSALGVSATGDYPLLLMDLTAETGTKFIKIWVPWVFMDQNPPFSLKPKNENGYIIVPGKRMDGWHKYFVKNLDIAVKEAQKLNVEIVLGIHGPPVWPRGERVCQYDLGTHEPCGIILQSHFETFKNALFDFSFYMGQRYPDIEYWIVYNEPNLPYAFLPQYPLLGGTLLNAYIELVYWPMRDGLFASGNEIKLVGPEITLLNVKNKFASTNWKEDWLEPILRDYPNHFDVLGVHSYAVDANQTLEKMVLLQKIISKYPHSTQRVWLTEFNFGTEKEKLTQTDSHKFINILLMLKNQWWERSYFFSFLGGLVHDDYLRFGKEKPLFFWIQKLLEN